MASPNDRPPEAFAPDGPARPPPIQESWWNESSPDTTGAVRAVAYYRHSAQDKQKNSVEIQQDQVRRWAESNQVTIVREFTDRGRSGLTADGRPAFIEMMEAVRARQDFSQILVLDVSRWGRFQDLDLSASYSAECKQHGKEVVYVNLGIENDGSPIYPLMVGFERWRSAQYSRELSDKVFKGCRKVAEQGYRAGGSAPYATHRIMVDEQNVPQKVLEPGERKSIQNWRVKLTPGEPQHVDIIQDIFHQFVDRGLTERQIAGVLNERGIVSPGGRAWTPNAVQRLLKNRTYAGSVVYNRTTGKLKTMRRPNPPETWVVTDRAYQPLIPPEIFDRARERFDDRQKTLSPQQMAERLHAILDRYGILTRSLIAADDLIPSVGFVTRHLGGMTGARMSMYADVREQAKKEVQATIADLNGTVQVHDDFLVINERFTVLVQPAVPIMSYESPYWMFRTDQRPQVDLTLGVPLADHNDPQILGYVAMPRLMMPNGWMRLSGNNLGLISLHGHSGLGFLKDYVA